MTKSKAGHAPEFSMLRAGGRTLRVAVWKAQGPKASHGRPLLFFNGIGANIELMAPLADWFPDRDLITFDRSTLWPASSTSPWLRNGWVS